MDRQQRIEGYIAIGVFLAILAVIDVAVIQKHFIVIDYKSNRFTQVAMLEIKNPNGEKFYFPVYKKGDKYNEKTTYGYSNY